MAKLFSNLTRIGIGLTLVAGAGNSMLYNGLHLLNIYNLNFIFLKILVHPVIVDGGHRAVIFDRFQGIKPDVIGEGTHFMIPWLHKPIIFDIRTRPRTVSVSTGSKGKLTKV
jgi:prohibitin 1